MTPPQEQAETADKAIAALRSAVDEITKLRSELQQKTDRIGELEQGADEMLAVWRNECNLRVSAQGELQRLQQAISKQGLTGDALVHLAEAHRADSELMDEAKGDPEQAVIQKFTAALRQVTEDREQAIQQRDKWLAAFNGSEQFQNGPTRRAEAAEAALRELRQYTEHKQNCRTRARFYISNGCKRCHGTGAIPSTDCDECPDCQETCPECNGRLAEVACTCGLSTLLGSGLLKP